MPKSIPTLSQQNWGQPLNDHLSQLNDPTTGGINKWTTASRPASLTTNDAGKTGINTDTGDTERWTGSAWELLTEQKVGKRELNFDAKFIWDFNFPLVGNVQQTPLSTESTKYYLPSRYPTNNCYLTINTNSILNAKTTGTNAYFYYLFKSLERFKGSDYPLFYMRYRVVSSGSFNFKLSFSVGADKFTQPINLAPTQEFNTILIGGNSWQELKIDLATNAVWQSSVVDALKFDFDNGFEIDIDYIGIGRDKTDGRGFANHTPSDNIMNQTGPALFHGNVKVNKPTFGTSDNGAVMTINSTPHNYEKPAGATGFRAQNELSQGSRDSVALNVEVAGYPVAFTIPDSGTTYTATSVSFTPANFSQIQLGMIIDTNHTPTTWSGFVSDIDVANNTIKVDAWYQNNGVQPAPTGTPADGKGGVVNPNAKIWGQNTNVFINDLSPAKGAAGYEMGIFDDRTNPSVGDVYGFNCVNLGTHKLKYGFIQNSAPGKGTYEIGYYSGLADINFQANGYGATVATYELQENQINAGPRTTGQVNFGTIGYTKGAQIKGLVTGAFDDITALSFSVNAASQVATERMRLTDQGNLGIGTTNPKSRLGVVGLNEYVDNTAALGAGLAIGDFYRTGDVLKVVH
jgi:hypothetical protein